MRYSEIDLQCEDIMWFGVDKNGFVFECTSGGLGPVPEFICKSRENTEKLAVFFMEELESSTQGNLLIQDNGSPLAEDSLLLSSKGIFCFDIFADDYNLYKKVSRPSNPLQVKELPNNIQKMLEDNLVDMDISQSDFVSVKHAY